MRCLAPRVKTNFIYVNLYYGEVFAFVAVLLCWSVLYV